MSFAKYANHVGVKAVLFYPKKNAYKIDQSILGKNVTSVEVDGSEADLKATLARFSKLTGIPILPTIKNQLDGNKIRAYYLYDQFKLTGKEFDWHAQALSSAFGPFGYYEGFEEIQRNDPTFKVPKFFGVQQEAVCPYVRRFGTIPENHQTSVPVIEPTLFRSQPTEDLYARMEHILTSFGGKLEVLLNEDYYRYQSFAVQMLQRKGIVISWDTLSSPAQLLEAAGVVCLCSILKAIDDGKIESGTSILVSITGGTRIPPTHRNRPQFEITALVSDENLLAIATEFRSRL